MSTLVPVVRYMVVCEKVVRENTKVHPVSLVGLISHLQREAAGRFPHIYPDFCAFMQLTGSRGAGRVRLEIRHSESDELVYQTDNSALNFSENPLAVQGLTIRIRDCALPRPGLYDVQFWYNDVMIAQQPILVK